jgi:hypothetical protein
MRSIRCKHLLQPAHYWPEVSLAGITIFDGRTGRPRTTINVEEVAQLTAEETHNGPRFRKYRERGGSEAYSNPNCAFSAGPNEPARYHPSPSASAPLRVLSLRVRLRSGGEADVIYHVFFGREGH